MIVKHRKENILLTREMGFFEIDKSFILNKNVDFFINFKLRYYVRVYNKSAKSMSFKLTRYSISDEDYELLRLS